MKLVKMYVIFLKFFFIQFFYSFKNNSQNINILSKIQVIKAVQKQHTEQNPYDKFGSGAESKLRLQETTTMSKNKANTAYYAAPVPEGRMRAQEQTRFVTPEVKSLDFERRHLKPVQDNRRPVPITSNTAPKISNAPKNPFDEDDDNNDKYDESKNPFADDEDDSAKTEIAKDVSDQANSNPFGEYDNNLNPFE